MALPGSGILSLEDIAAEFGGTVPHTLFEHSPQIGIPEGNTVGIFDFYGASGADYLGATSLGPAASSSASINPANASAGVGSFCLWALGFNQVSNYYTGTPSGWQVRNNNTSDNVSVLTTDSWDGAGESVSINSSGSQFTQGLLAFSGYTWAVSGARGVNTGGSTVSVPGITMPAAGIVIFIGAASGTGFPPNPSGYTGRVYEGGFANDAAAPRLVIATKEVSAGFVSGFSWNGAYTPSSGLLIGIT